MNEIRTRRIYEANSEHANSHFAAVLLEKRIHKTKLRIKTDHLYSQFYLLEFG